MFEQSVRVAYNSECLDCGAVEKEMMVIGAFYLCAGCYKKTGFYKTGQYDAHSDEYVKRLAKYKGLRND